MMLLRWCSRKAEQSFLLAIFLRSLFFQNSTGSLSGNFTISYNAGFFWNCRWLLAVEVRKYLSLYTRPKRVLPRVRFFLESSTMQQPLFSNLECAIAMSYRLTASGGAKVDPRLTQVSGLAMKSLSYFYPLKQQILRLKRARWSQFLMQTLTYSLRILQLMGQKLRYSEMLCRMQLELSPMWVTSEAEWVTRSRMKFLLALTFFQISVLVCSKTPHFERFPLTSLTLLYLLLQQVSTQMMLLLEASSLLWTTSRSQSQRDFVSLALAITFFLIYSQLMRTERTMVGTMPFLLRISHCRLLRGRPSRIQPLWQSKREVRFSRRVMTASSDRHLPALTQFMMALMSESSCSLAKSSTISSMLMILKPYLSLMFCARVLLPLLVLPMTKTIGTKLTSLGTASFCSKVLGFLITYSRSSSSLRQYILSLQISGQGLGFSIKVQGLSLPNLLSETMQLLRKSLTLNLSIASMLFFSHRLIRSQIIGLTRQFMRSVTCLISRSHFMLMTQTPQDLKASESSSSLEASDYLWALRASYF